MAVRKVLRMGHPLLAEVSADLQAIHQKELPTLIRDLFDTMHDKEGAGIAAPQLGVLLRVVVFGFESNERYPEADPIPPTVLINPVITVLDDAQEQGWEGCLSVPGMRGLVSRCTRIHYTGQDENNKPIAREAEGFHARVVLHECDHLDGILYPQRITDMRNFGFTDELADKVGC